MTMFTYFMKKLCTSKIMLLLHAVILAVGMFLVALFFTLGFNASEQISSLFDKYPNYSILYAMPTNHSTDEAYEGKDSELLAFARSNYELLQRIGNINVEIPVTEYRGDSDPVYLEKNIIAGSAERTDNSVWISKSVLDTLGLIPDEVIGSEAILTNAGVHTIAGVFDDRDDIFSVQCVVYSDEVFSPQTYYIDVCSMDEVQTTIDSLIAADYKVFSHISEIKSIQSYVHMTEYAVLFVSILIVFVTSVILYRSLKTSIEEMYTYLALLKAIGYTNKDCSLYVFTESIIIWICSTIIYALLCIFGIPTIMNILIAEGAHDLFGFTVSELFVIRFEALGLSVAISAVAVTIISLFCAKFVSKKQVYEIFYEGNL